MDELKSIKNLINQLESLSNTIPSAPAHSANYGMM